MRRLVAPLEEADGSQVGFQRSPLRVGERREGRARGPHLDALELEDVARDDEAQAAVPDAAAGGDGGVREARVWSFARRTPFVLRNLIEGARHRFCHPSYH